MFYDKSEPVRERVRLWEYNREGWTFHGKGLWYYPPGETRPAVTLIGSPNFGYRYDNNNNNFKFLNQSKYQPKTLRLMSNG